MHEKKYGDDICIHRCDVCAGLWCKPQALAHMKSAWMAEAVLDTGDPRVGSKLDEVEDIDCPEGHGKMAKRSDDKQSHIWFEECLTCNGIFLDAGEFTDLKYITFMDHARALIKGRRSPEDAPKQIDQFEQ